MEITQTSYVYRVAWKKFHNNNKLIDDMWDWADESIGPKNFRYRDLCFYFERESDFIMFTLRWGLQ